MFKDVNIHVRIRLSNPCTDVKGCSISYRKTCCREILVPSSVFQWETQVFLHFVGKLQLWKVGLWLNYHCLVCILGIITHAKRKRRELQTFFNQQLFCKIVINNEITGNHFFFLFCLLLIKTVNYWHGKGPRSFYLFWK